MTLDQETETALDIIRIIDEDLYKEVVANPEEFAYQVDSIADLIKEAYCSGWCDCEAENGLDGP